MAEEVALSKTERQFLLKTIQAYSREQLRINCSRDFYEEDLIDKLKEKLNEEGHRRPPESV